MKNNIKAETPVSARRVRHTKALRNRIAGRAGRLKAQPPEGAGAFGAGTFAEGAVWREWRRAGQVSRYPAVGS